MRKALFLSFALAAFGLSCNAQTYMQVHKNNGVVIRYNVDDVDSVTFVSGENINANANEIGDDETVSRLEIPHLDSSRDYICHKLANGEVNYSLEYDKSLYHAAWAAYVYDCISAQRNWTTRTNAWAGEPFYDNDKQYQVAGILSSGQSQYFTGYNRGHLVGSAERYYSQEANAQTFYMSNMSPMNGNFNSTYWGEIEDKARDNWGRNVLNTSSDYYGGTLYIVKGGALNTTTANPDPIMDFITVKNSNEEDVKMAVPRCYFMACLFVSGSGTYQAIGFWMEHKDYNNPSDDFLKELRRGAACSIDDLEEKTGIDFFCNLKDAIENEVESTYDISLWNGL